MTNSSANNILSINEDHERIAALTPNWFHYLSGTVLLISCILSIFSNGIVLVVFFVKDRSQLTRTNFYIAVICIFGFIMGTVGVPMVVASCFNKLWLFGENGCKYYAFLMTFGGLSTIMIIAAISIDRYIFVVRSNLSSYLSTTFSVVVTVACIVISLVFALCPLLGWNQYIYEGVGTACALDLIGNNNNGRSYVITLLVVFFVIPIMIIVFSYGSVYAKVIKESKSHLRSSEQQQRKVKMEKQLAVTISLIIGFFIMCWSPYAFFLLWAMFSKDTMIEPMLVALPAMIAKTAGIFTPFIYLARNQNFRNVAFRSFPCGKNLVHPDQTLNTVETMAGRAGPESHVESPGNKKKAIQRTGSQL